MRRKDKEITDLNLLHEVINQAEVCRIAMVDGKEPYVIPLSFGFDGKYIYFHSAKEGRKVNILCQNSRVCVEFEKGIKLIRKDGEKYCDWSVQYFSVICYGNAERIEDFKDKNYALNQIVKHYSPDAQERQFTEKELNPVFAYKIIIDEIVGKQSAG